MIAAASYDDDLDSAVYFAVDGVYLFDEEDDEEVRDWFVLWPDFNTDCSASKSSRGFMLQSDPPIKVHAYWGDNFRKELAELLTGLIKIVRSGYTTIALEQLANWDRMIAAGVSLKISSEEEKHLFSLLELGCAEAGILIYNYYKKSESSEDQDKAILSLSIAYETGSDKAVALYKKASMISASVQKAICTAMVRAAGDDSDAVVLSDEFDPKAIAALNRRIKVAKLDSGEQVRPFAYISNSASVGSGIFFAPEGVYAFGDEDDNDVNVYVAWRVFIDGVQRDQKKYGDRGIRIGSERSNIWINADMTDLSNDKLDTLLQTVVPLCKSSFGSSQTFSCETSSKESDIDMKDIKDDLGEHELSMSISGSTIGLGAEKMDDAESLEYCDLSSYKKLDYYNVSFSAPILDGATLVVVSASKNGRTKELTYKLSSSDRATGIVYELDENFIDDVNEQRDLSGDEICLCGQKKFKQKFEIQNTFKIEGTFDPRKLVVKYAKIQGADGESICVVSEIEYDGESAGLDPKGKENAVDFKIWKESSSGASSVDTNALHASSSDDTEEESDEIDEDEECDEDQSEDEDNDTDEPSQPFPSRVRPQKNKSLNPAAIIAAVIGYIVMWAVPGFWYTLLAMAVFIGLSFWMLGDASDKDRDGIMITELLGAGAALIWFLWKMIVALFN